MSAIRTLHGLVDLGEYHPWNSEHEVFDPVIRKATPEELARLDGPDIGRLVDSIGLIPRPIAGRYTDAEKARRESSRRGTEATRSRVCAAVTDWTLSHTLLATGGNVSEAARLLGVTKQTMHRRVTATRAAGRFPDEVCAALDGPRPRRRRAA